MTYTNTWAKNEIINWLECHNDGRILAEIEESSTKFDSGSISEREQRVADVVKNVIQHAEVRVCGTIEQSGGEQSSYLQITGQVRYVGGNRFIVRSEHALLEFTSANLRRFSFDVEREGWLLVLDLMSGVSR